MVESVNRKLNTLDLRDKFSKETLFEETIKNDDGEEETVPRAILEVLDTGENIDGTFYPRGTIVARCPNFLTTRTGVDVDDLVDDTEEKEGPKIERDSDINVTSTPLVGDSITGSTSYINNGDKTGEKRVTLIVNEEVKDSQSFTLEPGESISVSLSHEWESTGLKNIKIFGEEVTDINVDWDSFFEYISPF